MGHLLFPLQLQITTFGEPKAGHNGVGRAGQDRGSTGLWRFLLLNQVAPGTPRSPGGDRPCQLASPSEALPPTFLLVLNKRHTASFPGGPDLQPTPRRTLRVSPRLPFTHRCIHIQGQSKTANQTLAEATGIENKTEFKY